MSNTEIAGTWREENSGLINRPFISSTVFVGLLDSEKGEVYEPLYDKAGKYAADVKKFMAGFVTKEFPSNDLMTYFSLPGLSAVEASIRQKVHSAVPSVYADEDTLYAVLRLKMTADLTNGELELFEAQIEKQYANGWGGELEAAQVETACGDLICVCLWQSDMEFYSARIFQQHEQNEDFINLEA